MVSFPLRNSIREPTSSRKYNKTSLVRLLVGSQVTFGPPHHPYKMDPPAIFPTYTKKWHTKPYPAISPLRPELASKGKVVIITGGGTGIGLSIAKAFAQAGASQIGIIGRREYILKLAIKEIAKCSTTGAKIEYAVADVTKAVEINAAFTTLAEKLGEIDIFVSNACYLSQPAPVTEADDVECDFSSSMK